MTSDKRLMVLGPIAGFLVVAAFGVGVIATAAYDNRAVAVGAAVEGQVVEIEVGELFIKPSTLDVEPGPVTVRVNNTGGAEHNLAIEGLGKTPMIPGGESYDLKLNVEAGSYTMICEVPGHEDDGMTGVFNVAQGDAAADHSDHSDHSSLTPEEMREIDHAVVAAFPAETEGKGAQPLKPTLEADGTKVFELTAAPIEWEVEPGEFKQGFAYNEQIPGPTIRAELGDKIKIVLNNELPEPTVLHSHGLILPNDMDGVGGLTQDALLPGESFTYEFTLRNSGSHMYHSHFMADTQVPKGLLGAFIVEDPDDPEVEVDYTMIVNDGPLGYTINGKGFPATEPIVAKKGDLVRIRYMNEGLQIHPMHLHGIPQQVIAKDGWLLEHPYMADTVMVAPGERIDVLVEATELGAWAFHCHILNHVEGASGMFGMVTALVVQ